MDLQQVFQRSDDAARYDREIRYDRDEPEPSLRPEQAAWAKALLREKGFLRS